MNCEAKGCTKTATLGVCFSFTHHTIPETRAVSIPFLHVCQDHKETVKLEEILTEDGWQKVCTGFLRIGKRAPTRTLTELVWEEIPT